MSIGSRVSDELRAFADVTVTEEDFMQAQQRLQERIGVATQHRTRFRLVAAAAAVAICLAGAWWLSHIDSQTSAPPIDRPNEIAPDAQARPAANGFVEAYAAFDGSRAASFLADGVSDAGLGSDWRRFNRYLEATGGEVIPKPCTQLAATAAGTTMDCQFDYHALRSDELGRGPFGGSSFTLTVSDGRIVSAQMSLEYEANSFSSQMWEPFAAWVSRTHPQDASLMYADWPNIESQSMTPAAIRLWSQNTQEYVDRVLANRRSAAPGGPG